MKRKRGGQKGNQNARKHGFYSRDLTPEELSEFWNIITREGVAPEIALLRVKLRSSLQHDPANRRVLREAANLLAKWHSEKLQLDKSDTHHLKKAICDILESFQLEALHLEAFQPEPVLPAPVHPEPVEGSEVEGSEVEGHANPDM
ncbi:hypothetical protein ACFLYQ_04210 [Chloroflexota bacterium]